MSQEIPVKQADLLNYTQAMIRYVVYNQPSAVIQLLQNNGITVPANVTPQMLHVMTLKAMISSDSFKANLSELISEIAIENQYKQYKMKSLDGNYANIICTTTGACICCCSTAAQIFSPKLIQTAAIAGIGYFSSMLQKQGNAGINKAATPPPPPAPKSNVGTIVAVVVVAGLGVAGYLWWKNKKKGA